MALWLSLMRVVHGTVQHMQYRDWFGVNAIKDQIVVVYASAHTLFFVARNRSAMVCVRARESSTQHSFFDNSYQTAITNRSARTSP